MASPLITPVMTLPEYVKMTDMEPTVRPLVEMFARSSDIMQVIPFEGLTGIIYEGWRQAGLPSTMAFRAVNEGSTSGAGVLTPFQESAYIIDHDIPVDRAIVDAAGERRRVIEESNAMAKLGELWVTKFLKGDNTTQPREFSGLQKRSSVYGRTFDNSASTLGGTGISGGAALSLQQLDWAIENCRGCTHIISPWYLKTRWIQAARNTSLTGYLVQNWDELGRPKLTYGGKPILFGYEKDLHPPILPFTEVAPQGGSAVTSSIYCVNFSEQGVKGIQRSAMRIEDVGLLQDRITYLTHVSWTVGLVTEHDFCFTRLAGITNAAFVA